MADTPQPYRKVTPASGKGRLPTEVLVGAGLLGLMILLIGLTIAATNESAVIGTLTPVPLPTYFNKTLLAAGDIFYTVENLSFSIAAGTGYENPSLNTGDCGRVEIDFQPDKASMASVDAQGAYWVYARRFDAPAVNGWLPLDKLKPDRPLECPEPEG